VKGVPCVVDGRELLVRDGEPFFVFALVELGVDLQPCAGGGPGDQVDDDLTRFERLAAGR
jgi:hypothetical protein